MLKDNMQTYLNEKMNQAQSIELLNVEKEYAVQNELIPDGCTIIEVNDQTRFADAYIERCDKESEEVIAEESTAFLEKPMLYFKEHKNEFMYLETEVFDLIGVDAISIELDDVFGLYDAMLGLKLQKKYEPTIKEFLQTELLGDMVKYDLMFNPQDGLWHINFTLNYVEGFNEEMSIGAAYLLMYTFLFNLVKAVEAGKEQ